MQLLRRLAKLEQVEVRSRPWRVVILFEGPGSENMSQPTKREIDEATNVTGVRFVE